MSRIVSLVLCLTIVCFKSVLAQQPIPEGPKSKSTALMYSLACTFVPVGVSIPLLGHGKKIGATNNVIGLTIGSLGLLCGPGAGHLYAKNKTSFFKGVIIRGAAGAVAVYSLTEIEINIFDGEEQNNAASLFFLLGCVAIIGSTIHDIATTGKSVDQYNQKHGFSRIKLQPYYFTKHEAMGLAFSARF